MKYQSNTYKRYLNGEINKFKCKKELNLKLKTVRSSSSTILSIITFIILSLNLLINNVLPSFFDINIPISPHMFYGSLLVFIIGNVIITKCIIHIYKEDISTLDIS